MQLSTPTIYNRLQRRLDEDALTSDAEREQKRSIGAGLRGLNQKAEGAINILEASQDLFASATRLHSGLASEHAFLAGQSTAGRIFEGGVSAASVALGVGEIASSVEHFRQKQNLLGALQLTSGVAAAVGGAIGVVQSSVAPQFLSNLPLDRVSGVTSGIGGVMDGLEDFHEISKGAEKLGTGVVAGMKVTSGGLQIAGALFEHPLLEAVGSALYLGAIITQYTGLSDRLETDVSAQLTIYSRTPAGQARMGIISPNADGPRLP